MKKNQTFVLGGVVVVLIAAGVVYYVGQQRVQRQESQLNAFLTSIQANLPPGMSQSNVMQKGLFNTTGTYSLTQNDKNFHNAVVIDYTLEHGPLAWLGGDVKIKAHSKITGDVAKYITVQNGELSHSEGTIDSAGNIVLNSHLSSMTIKTPKESDDENVYGMTIEPAESTLNYEQSSGMIHTKTTYPSVTLNAFTSATAPATLLAQVHKLSTTYDFNINNKSVGALDVSTDLIHTNKFDAKNVAFGGKSDITNGKYNIHFNSKIGGLSIKGVPEQDVQLQLDYSLLGIDSKPLTTYKNIYNKYIEKYKATQDLNSFDISMDDKKALVANTLQFLQAGFVVSLDKFKIHSTRAGVELNAKIELKPSTSMDDLSVRSKTRLAFNGHFENNIVPLAQNFIAHTTGIDLQPQSNNDFKVDATYENHVLMVNKTAQTGPFTDLIDTYLGQVDQVVTQLKTGDWQKLETTPEAAPADSASTPDAASDSESTMPEMPDAPPGAMVPQH